MFKKMKSESVIAAVLVLWVCMTVFPMIALVDYRVEAKQKKADVPLPAVFQEYQITTRFEIPESEGATTEERQKWSLLRDVIACESGSRWDIAEVPGLGYDVGPCQIQTFYHSVPAARMGYDLFDPAQNMLYCITLFESSYPSMVSGAWSPWEATKTCWQDRQRMRKEQAKL